LCFSPDGKRLVSGGWDHVIRLWDVDSGKEISPQPAHQGHRGCINALAFSPNGAAVATAGNDGTLRIWEVKSGKQQFYVTEQENRPIWACAFTPKGRHIWSAAWKMACTFGTWPTRRSAAACSGMPMCSTVFVMHQMARWLPPARAAAMAWFICGNCLLMSR